MKILPLAVLLILVVFVGCHKQSREERIKQESVLAIQKEINEDIRIDSVRIYEGPLPYFFNEELQDLVKVMTLASHAPSLGLSHEEMMNIALRGFEAQQVFKYKRDSVKNLKAHPSIIAMIDYSTNSIINGKAVAIFADVNNIKSPQVLVITNEEAQVIFNLVWLDDDYPLINQNRRTILNQEYFDPVLRYIIADKMETMTIYLPNDLKRIRMPWEPISEDIF